jgi:hypothetical protein
MARQVRRDDVTLGGQAVEHGMPHLELAAGAVNEDERLPVAAAFVGEGHGRASLPPSTHRTSA